MTPTTVDGWIAVAKERAADADAMKTLRANSTGPVYMAGYAIECSLKAVLQSRSIPFPTHGQEGHNLRGLWEAAGFRLADLSDSVGTRTFFIDKWSTALRYEASYYAGGLSTVALVDAAKNLAAWIQNQASRRGSQSRR
jgi:hypothetical protein